MKVKIGKSLSRKSKVDLGFDNSTTASFGHCQPVMCKEMVPDSEFNVEVDSLVRLSPLVKPTFGRVKYKIWHNFVPLADIYKPFESMLSQMPFTTANGVEYIPTSVPQIELSELSRLFYTLDFFFTPYEAVSGQTSSRDNTANLYASGVAALGDFAPVSSSSTVFSFHASDLNSVDLPWHGMFRQFSGSSTQTHNFSDNWGCVYAADASNAAYVSTPVSADMLWTRVVQLSSSDFAYLLCAQRLTDRQRRLRKVLLGLGYSLDVNNTSKVSLLPLIAYYKAWFNTLFPERYMTWTQTNAYKLMENFADYGNNTITSGNTTQIQLFTAFMNDLCDTFYFDDADYYSAHLTGTSVGFASTQVTFQNGVGGSVSISNPSDYQPLMSLDFNGYTDTTLRMLRILTKFVNKNTQIGGKIAEYLRAHYGADLINNLLENYFIGGDSTDVVISDVMSNASTDGAELADYAGKGVGYKDGKNFTYKAKSFGYWITFAAVVPRSRWYQGLDPQLLHRDRFEYFTPEFDAVGFTLSPKSIMVNNEGIGTNALSGTSNAAAFGFIPRYSEYKVPTKNIVNGDITLPSTRNDLMPYTLDKTFTPVVVNGSENQNGGFDDVFVYKFPAVNAVASNLNLRRIGMNSEYGNYDRIFYANESAEHQLHVYRSGEEGLGGFFSGVDDNFIVHHIINIDAKIPMIPMSESFDTGGDEDDAMTVDKV